MARPRTELSKNATLEIVKRNQVPSAERAEAPRVPDLSPYATKVRVPLLRADKCRTSSDHELSVRHKRRAHCPGANGAMTTYPNLAVEKMVVFYLAHPSADVSGSHHRRSTRSHSTTGASAGNFGSKKLLAYRYCRTGMQQWQWQTLDRRQLIAR
jgi:hypothetical protein